MGNAAGDLDSDGRGLDVVFADFYLYYAGFAVQGFLLIEDEIADAVVDVVATIVLYALQGVSVMADQGISTGINDTVGLQTLAWYRLQGMFCSPVERDKYHSLRVIVLDAAYAAQQ